MKAARLGYRPELDALRVVACAAVFLSHAHRPLLPGGGWIGVGMFFALSGYLITRLLLIEQDKRGRIDVPAFYLRRARRLLPALAGLLAGVVLIVAAIGVPGDLAGLPWALVYLANMPAQDLGPLAHLWSLAVEEQFYVVWPLLFVGLLRLPRRWLIPAVGGLAVASAAWRWWLVFDGAELVRLQRWSDVRAESLLVGCLLAVLIHQGYRVRVARWIPVVVLAGLALADPLEHRWVLSIGFTAAALATAALIGSWSAAQQRSVLAPLGRYTYAFYLWHLPVLWALHGHAPATRLVVGGVLSCVAAWASWVVIERRWTSAGRTAGTPSPSPRTPLPVSA